MTSPKTSVPRIPVQELELEASLSDSRFLLVEGEDDVRFFDKAFQMLHCDDHFQLSAGPLVARSIRWIDVPSSVLDELGLNTGNRSRVIALAFMLEGRKSPILCLADQDSGHDIHLYSYSHLIWTDFPAVESYCLAPAFFSKMLSEDFAEFLPSYDDLYPAISFALAELFSIRVKHPHLPKPNIEKGMGQKLPNRPNKGVDALNAFDVSKATSVWNCDDTEEYPRPSLDYRDARSYGYGHDIAELLEDAFLDIWRKQYRFSSSYDLERHIMSSLAEWEGLKEEPLFEKIAEFAFSTRSAY